MNYTGILHNFNNVPLYTPPFELIGTTLQAKQGALDANRAKIQNLVDNMSLLDVYKDVDKQYVEERLNAVIDITNKYASMDLSDASLTNSLLSNINQIVDDNVKNAVYSTRLFRNEQQQWQQLKEKNPELYNQTNHAYAMRSSEAWRTSDKVGDVYRGGGDPIPYTDVNKIFMDAIPKLQEALKAEWVQDSEGNGFFRSLSTYEAVPRQAMENALNTLLGDKERNQLKINAWGTYSLAPDEAVREAYETYFNPQLEDAQESVTKYNKLIETETDPVKKQQYMQLRDIEERKVNDLSANSYDNIVAQNGKETAYTTLYLRQFKDNYLNAYSYAPREIKREVNQLDIETRNLEQKILDRERDILESDREFELALRKQEFAEAQLNPTGPQSDPLLGGLIPLSENEGYKEQISHTKAQQQLEDNAVKDLTEILKPSFGNLNRSQLIQLSGQITDLAGKDKLTIKIDGKTTTIDIRDPKNFKALKDFQNYVLNDSPSKKYEQKGISTIINQIKSDLTQVARGENPDIDLSALPNFGVKLVATGKDDKGNPTGYKVVPTQYKGSSYYGYLLKKENRSADEEATLDLYTSLHLIGDPKLTKEQRKSVFSTMQNNIYNKLSSEDSKKLPQNWYSAYGTTRGYAYQKRNLIEAIETGQVYKQSLPGQLRGENQLKESYLTQATNLGFRSEFAKLAQLNVDLKNASGEEKSQIKSEINRIKTRINNETELAKNIASPSTRAWRSDFYLSDFSSGDLEYSGGSAGRGFDVYISSSFKNLSAAIENQLADQNLNPSLTSQIFTPSQGTTYQNLAYTVGLPKDSKVPITLTRELNSEGQPTGKINVSYTGGTASKPVIVSSDATLVENVADGKKIEPLTATQAEKLGIDYASTGRPQYRAAYGENAPPVNLGSSKVDKEVENRIRRQYLDLPLDNVDGYLQEAQQYGVQSVVANAIDGFYQGSYKFKLEPRDGVWYSVMSRNGQEIYSESTNEADYTDDEIKSLYDNAYYFNQVVFNNYLSDLKNEAIREAKIANARR